MRKTNDLRYLIVILVMILVIVIAVCTGLICRQKDQLYMQEQQNVSDVLDEISSLMDSFIFPVQEKTLSLGKLPWVIKLCPDDAFLKRTYFTKQRTLEISEEFSAQVSAELYIKSLFLVFPYADVCVAANNWTGVDLYLRTLGLSQQDIEPAVTEICGCTGIQEVLTLERNLGGIVICVPMEKVIRSRAFLIALLDVNRMQSEIRKSMKHLENLLSFSVFRGEECVFRVGQAYGSSAAYTVSGNSGSIPAWEYRAEFRSDLSLLGYNTYVTRVIVFGCIAFLAVGALAYAVWHLILKPVHRTMTVLNTEHFDMHAMEENVNRLVTEYSGHMKTDLLRQLLQGCFEEDEASLSLMKYGIEINQDTSSRIFVIRSDRNADNRTEILSVGSYIQESLKSFSDIYCETLDTLQNELILICYSARLEALETFAELVSEYMDTHGVQYYQGETKKGLIGFSTSYQQAKQAEEKQEWNDTLRYYFPLSWENQLHESLRQGDTEVALSILTEVERENNRLLKTDAISEKDYSKLKATVELSLNRFAAENGLNWEQVRSEVSTEKTEGLRSCYGLCRCLAEMMHQSGNESDENQQGQQILDYLHEHYTESGLSLQGVADHFGISVSTVNKYLKMKCGMTFNICLTRIRIEKVKTLMSGTLLIKDVANRVGYDSDIVFRRVFRNYAGMTPTEYRKLHGDGKVKNDDCQG